MCSGPHSFILVGDSGEQDLELYVALARQYPANILAIYIRDVTTPFDPVAADPARRHSRERERARAVAAAAAESSQPGLPRRAGTDQLPPSSHESSSKRLSREPSLPPEITWKHRNSIHDLAGLIDDDALRFAAPEAFSPTMTSQRPSFEVERTLSDMPDLPGQWDGPHERPVPPRRSSDTELDDWASRAAPSASSGTATSPYTSSPAPLDSPSLMSEPDSDPLSPNNPIRPAPAGTAQDAAVEAFYRRVAAAEKGLPKGIILRLFRHGNECGESLSLASLLEPSCSRLVTSLEVIRRSHLAYLRNLTPTLFFPASRRSARTRQEEALRNLTRRRPASCEPPRQITQE